MKSWKDFLGINKKSAINLLLLQESTKEESDYIKMVNRKQSLLRGHTKAVINDAVAKAEDHISKGEFKKAKEAIEVAQRTVNANHLGLGDYLFKQYKD